mgnify:CR=1 FL=1
MKKSLILQQIQKYEDERIIQHIFLFLLYAVDNNVADTVGESEFVEALFAEAVADVGDVHLSLIHI